MNDFIIETKNLRRKFGPSVALAGLNLAVPPGSIYGFLGRNGAGKTTTIKILAGLLKSDEGEVSVLGKDPWHLTPKDRQKIGYVSEKQVLPPHLTIQQLINFCFPFYPEWDHGLVQRLVDQFKLPLKSLVKSLSLGTQRQVSLLLALTQKPDLLLLDEPASGLDVVSRREFLDQLLSLIRQPGKTVFFSSHILSDVERVADQVGIIANGRMVISESLDNLKETVKQVRFYAGSRPFPSTLPGIFNLRQDNDDFWATMRVESEARLMEVAELTGGRYEVISLNLEDLFVELARS